MNKSIDTTTGTADPPVLATNRPAGSELSFHDADESQSELTRQARENLLHSARMFLPRMGGKYV